MHISHDFISTKTCPSYEFLVVLGQVRVWDWKSAGRGGLWWSAVRGGCGCRAGLNFAGADTKFQPWQDSSACIVVTSPVVLRWLCDSPRTGCAWRITPLSMWRKQATIQWSRWVNSIVAFCHGVKLCTHAARDFRSQQNGAVTRMWRSFGVQPSHKERAIGVVCCEKEGMLLQPLRWCCVDCVIHHERDVREE